MDATPRILGRYALHGEIASGGMATVHVGRLIGAVGFSRTVAIKRLHPHYAKDPKFVAMFVDEARLAARIHHPNVVSTLDVVALEGELFVVMEYVQGESLANLLRTVVRKNERFPLGITLSIATGMLEGLHAAHEAVNEFGEKLGIVHRDVSPQNVIVGVDGAARLIDFGIAKAAGRLQTTREGQLKGKLPYMAHEQLAHGTVDRRTDVYAASVVLWEALAGRRLFHASSEAQLVTMILGGATEPPSAFAAGIPASLDAIVMRGLSQEPDERFATARDMARTLEQAVASAVPRDVGAWVQEVAAEALRARAAKVVEVETTPEPPEDVEIMAGPPSGEKTTLRAIRRLDAPPLASPTPELPVTHPETADNAIGSTTSMSATGPSRRFPRLAPDRTRLLLLAAPAALVLALLVVLALPRGRSAPQPAASAALATNVPVATTEPTTPPDDASIIELSSAEPMTSSSSTPHLPPHATARPTRTPGPPPACNPPYTVDANGVHRFKRECLPKP